MSEEEMERFHGVFSNGTYEDIWSKLFVIYDYFAEIAEYVGNTLGYGFDAKETEEVRMFLLERQKL
ncbi:MAG: aminoglycoside 6-adenylyltransferase [Lachnospiraceae bacterium]|nr:aminoglycoside 6-adenylyltransferase [Lachnospiraceae bacterium]